MFTKPLKVALADHLLGAQHSESRDRTGLSGVDIYDWVELTCHMSGE